MIFNLLSLLGFGGLASGLGTGILIVLLIAILFIVSLPFKLAIELAGKIVGADVSVNPLLALLLFIILRWNFWIGAIVFVLLFMDKAGVIRAILIAFLSELVLILIISLIALGIGLLFKGITGKALMIALKGVAKSFGIPLLNP